MHTLSSHYTMTQSKDYYGLKLIISFLLLIVLLASTSLYLIQNYYSKSFFDMREKKNLYFLESKTLKNMYSNNNMDYSTYEKRVKYIKSLAKEHCYITHSVTAEKLHTLPKNSIIVLLDMMALSENEIKNIDNFIQNGGNILFNFTSGFLNESLKYRQKNLVNIITGLSLNPQFNTIKLDHKSSVYLSPKVASPITKYLKRAATLDFNIYDPLPVFHTDKVLESDAFLTNWTQTNYIKLSEQEELNMQQSSLIWHGVKGKGRWIYFTFPSYVFMDAQKELYKKLFRGMLDYLRYPFTVIPYPYIDSKNIIFISEDTEYKYENLKQFHDISLKHKFPMTAFCVAQLAQKHKELMQYVSKSPYLEIGSHSYSHEKIVGKDESVYEKETIGSNKLLHYLTNKEISGFRAPREEVDKKLLEYLQKGNYKYILNEGENRLTPYFKDNILIIPRHATDDYSYLINLDWSADEILKNMIKELHTIVNLNGIYTLSTHTHLMSFGSNINILDKFCKYVKEHKDMSAMNGIMLYKRALQRENLHIELKVTQKKLLLTLQNSSDETVQNAHFEIYTDPNITLKDVESEIIGLHAEIKKLYQNKYLLIIPLMQPQSKITLFINYENKDI